MKRYAFTLLELVFVLIVIGILAVLAMPNFRGNPLQDAAEQVAGHIRYTQHLAMVDDKFDDKNATWYVGRWTINMCNTSYTIANTNNTGFAIDPLTKRSMNGLFDLNLTSKYGISSIATSALECKLSFDNLGRPYTYINGYAPLSVFDHLLSTNFGGANYIITLTHPDGTATITVRPETGYVSVSYP
jgi:prepilin-type N-terminal cleavage/methylation domain-containing protein